MLPDSSKLARLSVYILSPVLLLRYCFHLMFYYHGYDRKTDLSQELEQYRIHFPVTILNLLWAFHFDPYFLTLFYYRIGPSKATLCRLFKKESSTFTIICDKLRGGVVMFHPFATIINAKEIGNNLVIRNSTTIGNNRNDNNLRPTIGNNVEIGANVVIIGDITIGNNVTIGAGTLVNKNVPDNAIVVGNPFRIIGYHEIS